MKRPRGKGQSSNHMVFNCSGRPFAGSTSLFLEAFEDSEADEGEKGPQKRVKHSTQSVKRNSLSSAVKSSVYRSH